MTAEIGILNKTAIVLASDSAVTIGDGTKVYNTANKIFKLCNNGNVGIMIYNQANWMGIPLETIIKSFSKEFGDSTLPTLEEYKNHFIDFLKTKYYTYINPKAQEDLVKEKCIENLFALMEVAIDILQDQIGSGKFPKPADDASEAKEIAKRMTFFAKYLADEAIKRRDRLNEFKRYRITTFRAKFTTVLKEIVTNFSKKQKIKLSPSFLNILVTLVYHNIVDSLGENDDYTGIVIAGFGDDEIFPRIIELKLGEVFENRLRIKNVKKGEINDNTVAIISPFAQRDMVDTFMQGIEPRLQKRMYSIIEEEFKKLGSKISKSYNLPEPKLQSEFDKCFQSIKQGFFEFKERRYIQPIVKTVSFLSKEGVIELAESLVSITSLKRKTSLEVESVGGPVDIALITKGDGFRWIKKKD
jgi:hypothetical protein